MRNKVWLAIALVMILPVMVFTASCTKEVVQTQSTSTAEPEVQKAPDTSAEETEQAGQPEEDRLWEETAAREAAQKAFVDENVHFAFDSFVLSDQARQLLNSKADYLRTNPDITITIEGHCDERGTDAYNTALGEQRAESVKIFLADLGIDANRLNTVSYGEERPIAMGHNETSWAENRRAQFVIN
ncbi:MAG: peptidoglycan-associated lipoprotein Pal [Nitrospirota bacterium]|jgi:peptidoglycan-associated lipoprotein